MFSAGVDEAGRGSFLGDVFAGCVIWDDDIDHKWLNDSKKLTAIQRFHMRDFIIENCIAWGVGHCDSKYVDQHGIVKATMKSMHESIENMNVRVDHLYIDGNYYEPNANDDTVFTCVVKGDTLYKSISAASILAKTFHDDHIKEICDKNPQMDERYGLLSNMGYGTKKHIEGLQKFGSVDFHRKLFIKKYSV
jgi:ribonuclease HII